MILNYPSIFAQWSVPKRAVCVSAATSPSGMNTEQLREQLDDLHKEAEFTRAKASSARLRLMRLSEAAEKLKHQAAVSVRTGKENDARELLIQKKKVMLAIEKSKNRIELLDELSAKLHKVISDKENQLIGTVASELKVSRETASAPVRIISPRYEYPRTSTENDDISSHSLQTSQDDELQWGSPGIKLCNDEDLNSDENSVGKQVLKEVDVFHCLKDLSSYKDFLEHIDLQVNKLEDELNSFLTFSALILESKKLENSKVNQVMEILEDVHHIRVRISRMIQKEVELG